MSRLDFLNRREAGLGAVALVAFGATAIPGRAHAMRVSPMVVEISSRGAAASGRVEVQNLGSSPMPFETTISLMTMDNEGNITETPADEDFLLFPPQGLLPSNGRQTVRVQWIGAPDMPTSRTYYMSIRQIPVEFTDAPGNVSAAAIQIVYNMKVLLNVAPPGSQPKVEVVSTKAIRIAPPPLPGGAPLPAGAPAEVGGLEVRIRNSGTRYALMGGASWRVEGTDTSGKPVSIELKSSLAPELIGIGFVPPGGERIFRFATFTDFDDSKPINIRFGR